MHSLPPTTPVKSIYWFFNQGQAESPCCVSETLVRVHLRNTLKTKVNKYLSRVPERLKQGVVEQCEHH